MRFKVKMFIILLFGLILAGCKGDENPLKNETNEINGRVTVGKEPVAGAIIQVGNIANLTTITDAQGYFELKSVPNGELEIVIEKTMENKQVIGKKIKIAVHNNIVEIGEIQLSKMLAIREVDESMLSQQILKITWEKAADEDFMVYRVYRSTTPIQRENEGLLIYETGNPNDTVFVDRDFRTGIYQYYRVYEYSYSGRYSGSNIVTIKAPAVNIISNGSFEETTNGILPLYWRINVTGNPQFDYFKLTNDFVANGLKGLKINYVDSLANPTPGSSSWGGIIQTISTSDLRNGEEYVLTFWHKTEIGSIHIRLLKNGIEANPLISYIVPPGKEWSEQRFSFTKTSDINFLEIWINTKASYAIGGIVKAYLDDIKIIK